MRLCFSDKVKTGREIGLHTWEKVVCASNSYLLKRGPHFSHVNVDRVYPTLLVSNVECASNYIYLTNFSFSSTLTYDITQ